MVLNAEELVIRSYDQKDSKKVYQVINDPYLYETTLQIPYPYPEDQVEAWLYMIQKNSEHQRGYEYGIFLKEQYIGHIGLVNIDHISQSAELTYWIGSSYKGKGYATMAARAMIRFGFESLNLERIVGRAMSHNKASIRVLEKCGFKGEGIARHEVCKDGRFIDVFHSAILHSDHLGE